jgi:iron complex transport system permease protein
MQSRSTLINWPQWLLAVAVGGVLYAVVAFAALGFGSSSFGAWEMLTSLVGGGWTETERAIIWQARLPRVGFAGVVGAALAVGGAVFQANLRNPLADPYILGISGGAALGGTLWMALATGLGGLVSMGTMPWWITDVSPAVAAFGGALGALGVIWSVARWTPGGRSSTYVLLLTGVIVNAFASSVILFVRSVVSARQSQELLFYLMGTLAVEGTGTPTLMTIGAVVLVSLLALGWWARDLNVISLGDDEAAALGVDIESTRWWTVGIASLAVACAVALTGLIGFVGLVVPHAVRLIVGPDHRLLLPCCALGGAAFLTGCDLLTRVSFGLLGTALPVGVVTAFVGAPLFMVFLWRNLSRSR